MAFTTHRSTVIEPAHSSNGYRSVERVAAVRENAKPMTGLVDRLERELYAARAARPRDSARYAAVLERAVRTCGADSQAFDPTELYLELATEYQVLGRLDDALAAADAAVDPATRCRSRP